MSIYCYTVWINGVEMAALAPFYQWRKVCEYFGLGRGQISRGSKAGLPHWDGPEGGKS